MVSGVRRVFESLDSGSTPLRGTVYARPIQNTRGVEICTNQRLVDRVRSTARPVE